MPHRKPAVIEIIVVDRLGSVTPGAPLIHNHPIGVPCRFIRDDSGVVEPDDGPDDGLPELPSGYEVARSNKDRKFELPHPIPATRKQIPEFHMHLTENVVMSNGGVNGEIQTVFLNQVMLRMDPCEERWSKVPADMLVVDGWLRVKIMIFIENGGDFHLLREVRGVRRSWFQDKKKVVTGRKLLAIFYNSLRRSSSRQMNMNNINHLLELSYNSYLDKYMEELSEEFNRRTHLIENVDPSMVEAYLQKQQMISRVMRTDMNEYRMKPESEQAVITLLEIPEKWMTLRALNRTTGRETLYSPTQFGAVKFQPKAPTNKHKNEKGHAAFADKNQEKGGKYGDGSSGADRKAKGKGGNGGNGNGKKRGKY